ncbi:MAG: 50S ribosomal protein L23 [bacterium]
MNQDRLLQVVLSPHVSEKTAMAADAGNQYAFKVSSDATKREIAKAIESLFGVSVEAVRVVNTKGKVKRMGMRIGKRASIRKAYVRLKEGDEIDFLGAE